MNDTEELFKEWIETGSITVVIDAAELAAMIQQLKGLLLKACDDLESREIVPPAEGHLVASSDFVAWVRQKFGMNDHPHLPSALGGATRLFLAYQNSVTSSGQEISKLHKFNLDDCCLRGFFIRVQDLVRRVTALENKVDRIDKKLDQILSRLPSTRSEARQGRGAPQEHDEVSGTEGEGDPYESHLNLSSTSASPIAGVQMDVSETS